MKYLLLSLVLLFGLSDVTYSQSRTDKFKAMLKRIEEAAKKAEEAKLAFTRAAKAANLAAEQAAKEAAEQAAQLASELATAKSKASRIIEEEEAAAALARQAEAHAAQIQQTWRF